MLGWLRRRAWLSTVGADFEDKYGVNIYRLAQAAVGAETAKLICEMLWHEPLFLQNPLLAGEELARILEQGENVPVNKMISDAQSELMRQGKWEREITTVRFPDPFVAAKA